MPRTHQLTVADLAAMPDDGNRHEIVNGELLVSPAPGTKHQLAVTRIMASLLPYLAAHGLADQLLTAPIDITLNFATQVQPDLLVADTAASIRSRRSRDITALFLFVEIISPSTARADRTIKRPACQHHRIPQFWIVNIDRRELEVWTPDAPSPTIVRDHYTWRHPLLDASATDAGCLIDVAKLLDFG